MTNEDKITMLTYMTGETDSNLLSTYLTLAEQIVFEKAFPYGNFPETIPAQYDGVHVEIAAYMLNKRGAEGETVHLENGLSRHWEDGGVSPSLLRRIIPFAGTFSTPVVEEEPAGGDEVVNDEIDEP